MRYLVKIGFFTAALIMLLLFWLSRFQPISSVLPIQKFTENTPLVLGNLAIRQEFSISLWLMPVEDNPDWAAILDYRHSGTKSFAFHQKGGEKNLFAFGVHAENGVHGTYVNLVPGRWQHVFLVKTLDEIAIYVNGHKVSSKHFDRSFQVGYAGDEILTIGGWGYGGRYWRGSVACVQVFDYPLSVPMISILNFANNGCLSLS